MTLSLSECSLWRLFAGHTNSAGERWHKARRNLLFHEFFSCHDNFGAFFWYRLGSNCLTGSWRLPPPVLESTRLKLLLYANVWSIHYIILNQYSSSLGPILCDTSGNMWGKNRCIEGQSCSTRAHKTHHIIPIFISLTLHCLFVTGGRKG